MESLLYQYNMTVPLIYNTYDLRTHERDSELVNELDRPIEWSEEYEIKEPVPNRDGCIFRTVEKLRYSVTCEDIDHNPGVPESFFVFSAGNVICYDQKRAFEKLEGTLHNVCRALSLMISSHNCNMQGYQPRVYPDYDKIEWSKEVYEPFRQIVEGPDVVEYVDENGKKCICVKANIGIGIRCEAYMKIYGHLPSKEFFRYFCGDENGTLDYVMEEYYIALGQENMTSKFFHLFSIVEFIEKKYVHMAGASPLLNDKEIQSIIENLSDSMEIGKGRRKQVLSALKGNLSRMTDIGRAGKLVNILHAMGIESIENGGETMVIETARIQQLIDLRNKNFHGGRGNGAKKTYISIPAAVTELMYICLKIIEYIMNQKE